MRQVPRVVRCSAILYIYTVFVNVFQLYRKEVKLPVEELGASRLQGFLRISPGPPEDPNPRTYLYDHREYLITAIIRCTVRRLNERGVLVRGWEHNEEGDPEWYRQAWWCEFTTEPCGPPKPPQRPGWQRRMVRPPGEVVELEASSKNGRWKKHGT